MGRAQDIFSGKGTSTVKVGVPAPASGQKTGRAQQMAAQPGAKELKITQTPSVTAGAGRARNLFGQAVAQMPKKIAAPGVIETELQNANENIQTQVGALTKPETTTAQPFSPVTLPKSASMLPANTVRNRNNENIRDMWADKAGVPVNALPKSEDMPAVTVQKDNRTWQEIRYAYDSADATYSAWDNAAKQVLKSYGAETAEELVDKMAVRFGAEKNEQGKYVFQTQESYDAYVLELQYLEDLLNNLDTAAGNLNTAAERAFGYTESDGDSRETIDSHREFMRSFGLSTQLDMDDDTRTYYLSQNLEMLRNQLEQSQERYNEVYGEYNSRVATMGTVRTIDDINPPPGQAPSEDVFTQSEADQLRNEMNALSKQNDELTRLLATAEIVQANERYMALGANDDFYTKSQFDSSITDETYKKVNSQTDDLYQGMTKTDIRTYNYIYKTQGAEEANKFLDHIDKALREERAYRKDEEWRRFGEDNPFWGSVLSVPMSIGGGVVAAGDYLYQDISSGTYDPTTDAQIFGAAAQNVRQGVTRNMGETGAFVYNTAMSGLDSLAASFIPGGSYILAASAAASSARDAAQRGGSALQTRGAFLVGGLAEAAFESISIGNLNALKESAGRGVKAFFVNALKSMFVNATEEALTETANILWDTATMGDVSNYRLAVQKYIDAGMSQEKAEERARGDMVSRVVESAASGALMGLGFSAAGTAYSAWTNRNTTAYIKRGAKIKKNGEYQALLERALRMDPSTVAYKLARNMQSNVVETSDLNIGCLAACVDGSETADQQSKRDEKAGVLVRDRALRADEDVISGEGKPVKTDTIMPSAREKSAEGVVRAEETEPDYRLRTAEERFGDDSTSGSGDTVPQSRQENTATVPAQSDGRDFRLKTAEEQYGLETEETADPQVVAQTSPYAGTADVGGASDVSAGAVMRSAQGEVGGAVRLQSRDGALPATDNGTPTATQGAVSVATDGVTSSVREGTGQTIQTPDSELTAGEQRDLFFFISKENGRKDTVKALEKAVQEEFGKHEGRELLEDLRGSYEFNNYIGENGKVTADRTTVMEAIFADAYAGISETDAQVLKLTDVVRRTVGELAEANGIADVSEEFGADTSSVPADAAPQSRLKTAEEQFGTDTTSAAENTHPADVIPDESVELPIVPSRDPAVQREFKRAAKIAQNFGCRLRVGIPEGGGDGSYLNGVITINPNCENPVMQVLIHELTHRLESSRQYGRLQDLVRRHLESRGVDVDAQLQAVVEQAEARGESMTPGYAMRELVAQYTQTELFQNEQAIQRLLREERSVFNTVRNWLSDAVHWLTGNREQKRIIQAQRLFEKALRTSDPKMGMSQEQHLYAGQTAKIADLEKLTQAEEMENTGADAEEIRQTTGWFRGMDGKWRFEIDDSGMRYHRAGDAQFRLSHPDYVEYQDLLDQMLAGTLGEQDMARLRDLEEVWGRERGRLSERVDRGNARLMDLIDHPALFEAYPQLRDARVVFEAMDANKGGRYDPRTNTIAINESLRNAPESEMLHELQHAVQEIEGFAGGSNQEYWERQKEQGFSKRRADTGEEMTAHEMYRNTAGEIEARDAANRRGLSKDARRLTAPDLGNADTVFAEDMDESVQAIKRATGNRPFVEIDRDILAGVPEADWVKTVKGNLRKKYPNGVAVGRNQIRIDQESRQEMTYSRYTRWLGNNDPNLYADKLRVTDNSDEILYATTNWVNEGLDHPRKDDIVSFARGDVLLRIGGNDYAAEVLVGERKNGKLRLYDVINLKPTSIIEKEMRMAITESPSPETDRNTMRISNSSIRQENDGVNRENSAAYPDHYDSMNAAPADDVRPLRRAEDMEGAENDPSVSQTADSSPYAGEPDAAAETDTEQEQSPEQADPVESLPTKAKEYLKRVERALVGKISNALSVPKLVGREHLQPAVRYMSQEYLTTGKVSQETLDSIFESAYQNGIVVETEFYDQYKHIRDHIRKQAVTLSAEDQADIADFGQFRKTAVGLLKIKNEGGLPVDVAYMELQGMAPKLFPSSITHPADQLVRMYEVAQSIEKTEKSLDEYYGEDAAEFKEWARRDFVSAIEDSMAELRTVGRYAQEHAEKKAAQMVSSMDEVRKAYSEIRDARKAAEKAVAKNLLTDYDNVLVGQLLKGEITLEDIDPRRANVKGIRAVFEAKQEYEAVARVIREYQRQRKAKLYDWVDGFLETANKWKDKGKGILYAREMMERNIRDIVGDDELARQINNAFFKPVHDAQAESTRFKNRYRDRVKALELSRKVAKGNEVSEAYAVQLIGEAEDNIRVLQENPKLKSRDGKNIKEWRAVVNDLWARNPGLDRGKIEGAVKEFRAIYDELFQQMNDVRLRNGYEPVAYRQGYFPHFQQDDGGGLLASFGRALGIDTAATALPTTINGITHTFQPGITWFGHAQERLGYDTAYDAVQGFDRYIEGAADVIHHTDNIQALRALANRIRYRASDEGIRKQVDAVQENKTLTEDEKQKLIREIYEDGKFSLANFVVELEEYTNLLANKKSRSDRNMERLIGRNMYNVVKKLEGRVAANMVAINPGSWLTNFIPLTQAWGEVSSTDMLRGMWDTLRNVKTPDGMVERSTFLTNRRGSDALVKDWSRKTSETLAKPMEWIDQFTSGAIVRAKYAQNLRRGMSEAAAMADADAFAAGVIADRSKGSMPTIFSQSNPLTKVFTQFQLEVNNQFSYLFKDIPKDMRDKGLGMLALALLKFFLGAFLYNEAYEKLIGRRPALDPIGMLNETVGDLSGWELPNLVDLGAGVFTGDMPSFETERKGTYGAVAGLTQNVVEEMPFVGGLVGGGRVPISSALPNWENVGKAVFNGDWSAEKRWSTLGKEAVNPLAHLALPFGGGQVKKVWQGTEAVVKGGSYSMDAAGNELLQYPVYNDTPGEVAGNWLQSAVFGKNSLPTAREWVDSGFDTYNKKQTAVYQQMNGAGVSDRDAHKLLNDLQGAKPAAGETSTTAKKRVLLESGINEDGKMLAYFGLLVSGDQEAVDKKRDEVASVLASGVEFDEWLEFEVQTAGLKGTDGGSSKKDKVMGVINSMDLNWKQKDALYLTLYKESTLDDAPWYFDRYRLPAP